MMNYTEEGFLPIHPAMRPFLTSSMRVAHNGGSGRQGMVGWIARIDIENIYVRFDSHNSMSKFSTKFFLENFYIQVKYVRRLRGFKHEHYILKYSGYITTVKHLKSKQLNNHEQMKAIVDAKASGYTSVYNDKSDPLDEVGEFFLVHRGKILDGLHKTQRLAEIAASKFTKENRCGVGILKCVAETKPICDAEIVRK